MFLGSGGTQSNDYPGPCLGSRQLMDVSLGQSVYLMVDTTSWNETNFFIVDDINMHLKFYKTILFVSALNFALLAITKLTY